LSRGGGQDDKETGLAGGEVGIVNLENIAPRLIMPRLYSRHKTDNTEIQGGRRNNA